MDGQATASRGKRFTSGDWIAVGLAGLRQDGPDALTIEKLTAQAQRTRGSFYHHFASHEHFVRALAERWLRQSTVDPIDEMQQAGDVRRIRSLLSKFSGTIDHQLERQMRRLGEINPDVRAIIRQSDERRIAMLVQMFKAEFKLSAAEALKRAQLQHAVFVGLQVVFPNASTTFRHELDRYLASKLWV